MEQHLTINGSVIRFEDARQQIRTEAERRHQQAVMLNEFRNSYCDLFDIRDFRYYARETGKDVQWLLSHAKWDESGGMYGTFFDNAIANGDSDTLESVFLDL